MKFMKLVPSMLLLVALVGFNSFTVLNDPPTREAALEAYNNGIKVANEDPNAAIELLEKAVEIATQLDSNGMDILAEATEKLPGLYYNRSANFAKEKKYDEAIESFKATMEVASQYEDEKIVDAANKTLYKLYFARGYDKYKADDYDGAIADIDASLELQPKYGKAMYIRGLTLEKKGDVDGMIAQMDALIELDSKMADRAAKAAHVALKGYGKDLNKEKKYSDAVKYLTMAIEKYPQEGKDADATNAENAGVYFELGNAYWGLQSKGEACAAYRKAAYGAYEANAKYQIDNVVKCN